jgi:hypothetical protein
MEFRITGLFLYGRFEMFECVTFPFPQLGGNCGSRVEIAARRVITFPGLGQVF